jgi:hypothetical protein
MLFLVFGSSASGKTAVLDPLRERLPELAVHDFDEVDVPSRASKRWRQEANDQWVSRALSDQADGVDLLLAGQTPFGELLAAPNAARLEAISGCLLDCDDTTRVERLEARGPEFFTRTGGDLETYLSWAEWLRGHARDPQCRPFVIRRGSSAEMRWERWSDWRSGDRRWRVAVVDTTELPVVTMADKLAAWVADERTLHERGAHPLGPGAWADWS